MPIQPPDINGFPRLGPGTRGGRALFIRSVLRLQQSVGNREVVRLLVQEAAVPPPAEALPAHAVATCASLVPMLASVPALPWGQRLVRAWRRLASRRSRAATPSSKALVDTVIEIENDSARR
jgi:hypothetical protein